MDRDFLGLCKMMTGAIMLDATDGVYFHAIGLTVVILAVKIAINKDEIFFPRFLATAFKGTPAKGQHVALSSPKNMPEMRRATTALNPCLRDVRLQFSFPDRWASA